MNDQSYHIPYGRQDITQEDIEQVVSILKSDFLTQGPKIAEFETEFARYVGSDYAVAVSNGTAALHLCAMALDVNEGTKVITTPITFSASANCIKYCGGEVHFSDIDPETYLLDLDKVTELLETSPEGTFSGIIPVDFAGRSVEMKALRKIADRFGLWIIEDSCHAPGGFFHDDNNEPQYCGNGKFANLSIFSFHPVKHIACGEGGMITTNDKSLYERLMKLRTHGISKNESQYQNTKSLAYGIDESEGLPSEWPGWYMELQELGYNYRLTDFQAALGMSQLNRAGQSVQKRREIAKRYTEAFKDNPNIIRTSGSIPGHAYHLFIIEVENRAGLYKHLRSKGVFAQIHYIPVHLMPYYQEQGWKKGDFPHSESYYKHCISLPMFPTLTENELNFVINEVNNFVR